MSKFVAIGKMFRHKRRAIFDYTQDYLCDLIKDTWPRLDYTPSYISSIENGNVMPSTLALKAICNVLEVKPDELYEALEKELEHHGKRDKNV